MRLRHKHHEMDQCDKPKRWIPVTSVSHKNPLLKKHGIHLTFMGVRWGLHGDGCVKCKGEHSPSKWKG